MLFEIMNKYERPIYVIFVVVFVAFGIFQFIRPDPTSGVYDPSISEYAKGNHDLRVYFSDEPMNLRITPDFRRKAGNIAEQLDKGSLFYLSDDSKGIQTFTIRNYPEDNHSVYEFHKIHVLKGKKVKNRYVRTSLTTYVGDRVMYRTGGYFGKSLTLTEWIRFNLKESGCDFDSPPCEFGHFGYIGDGYYFTTLLQDSLLYNRNGDILGTIEAGTKVLTAYNVPFSTGYEDPTLFRFVGYIPKDSEANSENAILGTFFADLFGFDSAINNGYTIATMAEETESEEYTKLIEEVEKLLEELEEY